MADKPRRNGGPGETLAERIARLREGLGLSRGDLAVQAKVRSGHTLVGKWESGTEPKAGYIVPLADALGVSCDYLLRGHEHKPTR